MDSWNYRVVADFAIARPNVIFNWNALNGTDILYERCVKYQKVFIILLHHTLAISLSLSRSQNGNGVVGGNGSDGVGGKPISNDA